MKEIIQSAKCAIGIHKYGNVKEEIHAGKTVLAQVCQLCGKVKPIK